MALPRGPREPEVYVLVEHGFQYTGRDGLPVAIQPNERYQLLRRSNAHWWHVRRDPASRPFYLPALYVRELPTPGRSAPGPAPASPRPRCAPAPLTYHYKFVSASEAGPAPRGQPPPDDEHPARSFVPPDGAPPSSPSPDSPPPDSAPPDDAPPDDAPPDNAPSDGASSDSASPDSAPPASAPPASGPPDSAIGRFSSFRSPERSRPSQRSHPAPGLRSGIYLHDGPAIRASHSLDDLARPPAAPPGSRTKGPHKAVSVAGSRVCPRALSGSDTDRLYESLRDLEGPAETDRPAWTGPTAQVSSDPVPPDPVYVNLEALRRVVPPDSWETHTDADSGQPYYYNPGTGETTWEPPADPGPSSPVPSSPVVPEAPEASEIPEVPEVEWEKYWDEESQRIFYYNPLTREAMWEEPSLLEMQPDPNSPCSPLDPRPPTPETDYPGALDGYPAEDYFPRDDDDGAPLSPQLCEDEVSSPGWQCQTADDGQRFYTSLYSQGLWIESEDEQGKPYFYNPDERLSLWELPQVQIPSPHSLPKASSESSLDSGHVGPWPEPNKPEEKVKTLDKAGVLFRTRTVDRGKRLRKKNWSSSWTVLEGGVLTFFKDSKTSTASGLRQPSTLSTPEFTVELRGAVVSSASRDKSSKKNVLELKSRDGSEYLIRHDSETIIDNWHIAIAEGIRSAELPPESENTSSSGAGERLDGGRDKREEEDRRHLGHSQAAAPPGPENLDSHKVGYKLRKFLLRRPTLQALRDKGYIKDQVFGCSLPVLCEREKRSVPAFVQQCIQAVEARGLDIDGLYRISGNLATIQKLRYRVDHEEHLDLQDGRWEDVHILTGALKLFFRELPEPLFPFSHFQQFIAAVKLQDPAQRSRCTRDLVRTLPSVNQNTMRVLFQHLCRVVEHQEENRMSVQSVAIVFGPTLLKPERDEGNMTVNMVFQNQLVELMLQQCHYIFPEA